MAVFCRIGRTGDPEFLKIIYGCQTLRCAESCAASNASGAPGLCPAISVSRPDVGTDPVNGIVVRLGSLSIDTKIAGVAHLTSAWTAPTLGRCRDDSGCQ